MDRFIHENAFMESLVTGMNYKSTITLFPASTSTVTDAITK